MATPPGSIPGNTPTKILTILGDQPIGTAQNANNETLSVYPAMSFVQMLQRIVSYIGQPGTNATGGSLSDQVSTVTEFVNTSGPTIQTASDDVLTLAYFSTLNEVDLGASQPSSGTGAIYAPLVNGDAPGSVLPGYPIGMIKGPTLMSDPWGQTIQVQIR